MNNSLKIQKLTDDVLDSVSGGRSEYSDKEFTNAGVKITIANGKREYSTILSSGSSLTISESVANNMVDCFMLAGTKLTDQELDELIKQSR